MKHRWVILIALVLATAVGFGIWRWNEKQAHDRMLTAVDLGGHSELGVYGSARWTDLLLKYTDGYEIMLFAPGEEQRQDWMPPASWTRESIPVAELAERLQIRFASGGVRKAGNSSMGGDHCDAWFFLDRRDPELPFEEREYYLGYWDESRGMIYVYHGHHLWGI